jgi:glycosyltransferase involved in cell wall biosynthesis
MAHVSEPYDLFITLTHDAPLYCHAKYGVFYVTFPIFDREKTWMWAGQSRGLVGPVKNWLRRSAHDRFWQDRLGTYQSQWAISDFTARWTSRRWGAKCDIIHPPVSLPPLGDRRLPRVVVLGRFVREKRHLDVVRAFLHASRHLPGWELVCIGALSDKPEDRDYFSELEAMTSNGTVRLRSNVDRSELVELLGSAELFVHAMGYGVDEELTPELIEHFGIATVEAMAAGCIPLVIDRGGQAEIVRDAVDGFHWGTLEHLSELLVRLGSDPALRQQMRGSAVERAAAYDCNRFADQVRVALGKVLETPL